MVWRNYVKPLSEQKRNAPPGIRLGVIDAPLRVEELLRHRLFPWRTKLQGWLARCYYGQIPTRCLPRCRDHALSYAV